jgi:hypothetical protein
MIEETILFKLAKRCFVFNDLVSPICIAVQSEPKLLRTGIEDERPETYELLLKAREALSDKGYYHSVEDILDELLKYFKKGMFLFPEYCFINED